MKVQRQNTPMTQCRFCMNPGRYELKGVSGKTVISLCSYHIKEIRTQHMQICNKKED